MFLSFVSCTVTAQERSGVINGVWYENGKYEYEPGIWFKVDFNINGCYSENCTIVIYFYDENGNTLKDKNQEYYATDGTICTMEDFTPGFQYTQYTKYPLFIPVNEFHVGPGKYKFLFKVSLFWRDKNQGYHHIATSDFYKLPFDWYITESGEIANLNIDYNKNAKGKNGIQFTLDYSVYNMEGKRGRFVVEFYYDLDKFSYLYKHGKESEGIMSFVQEFNPQYETTDFTGATCWVPYDLFPLKIGRNIFYFKVWLEALSEDNQWYILDATSASQFYVDNGELKLKEVWVLEEKVVLLDWNLTTDEMQTLKDLLIEFNARLYDATDGQIRIKRFIFKWMYKHPNSHFDPVIRIYKNYQNGDHGDRSGSQTLINQLRPYSWWGSPNNQCDVHFPFEVVRKSGFDYSSRVLVHEFFHAAFGLLDEYGEIQNNKGNSIFSTLCAKTEVLRHAWNVCIMGSCEPFYREMCKPDTHTKDKSNSQIHNLDCYSLVQQQIKKAFGKKLVIPETPIEGPMNPPTPTFQWN